MAQQTGRRLQGERIEGGEGGGHPLTLKKGAFPSGLLGNAEGDAWENLGLTSKGEGQGFG